VTIGVLAVAIARNLGRRKSRISVAPNDRRRSRDRSLILLPETREWSRLNLRT